MSPASPSPSSKSFSLFLPVRREENDGRRMNGGDLVLPPGFRFHPTDEELVLHYLCRRCSAMPIPVPVIAEVDLYKYDPWQLPGMAFYGEKEWYFFSPRDRKYPNGSRPNRAAGTGYWKATGADKPIGWPRPVAIKKALVFYAGKPPKGEKTNWIMHEYRLADVDRSARKKNSTLRLDDWVLCRIYHKQGALGKRPNPCRRAGVAKKTRPARKVVKKEAAAAGAPGPKTEMICFDSSESLPKLLGESSSSDRQMSSPDHVLSSPELAGEWEVESPPGWDEDCEDWDMDLGVGLIEDKDATTCGSGGGGGCEEWPPLSPAFFSDSFPELFAYLQ